MCVVFLRIIIPFHSHWTLRARALARSLARSIVALQCMRNVGAAVAVVVAVFIMLHYSFSFLVFCCCLFHPNMIHCHLGRIYDV